jgi:hypothetical protein
MKILVFTEGTILVHRNAYGHSREEIVEQVRIKDPSIREYSSYVPVGNCVKKLQTWKNQEVTIIYLTSRRTHEEVEVIKNVIKRYDFPDGELLFRQSREEYKDIAERMLPDILIEDDCESIGGEKERVYPHIKQELRTKIKSVVVKEFGGIDHLPDNISDLLNC